MGLSESLVVVIVCIFTRRNKVEIALVLDRTPSRKLILVT